MSDRCFLVVPQMIDMWMKKEYVSREILGVEYLGAALKKANVDCVVLNAYAQRLTNDEVCQMIMKENYKVVGVACPSQRSYPFSKDLVKKLRNEYNYKGYITMGGFYVSLAYREILEDCKEIDYLMRGEGERTIAPFYTALFNGESIDEIKGITYLKNGEIITKEPDYIEELDEIPFPIRDMNNFKQFKNQAFRKEQELKKTTVTETKARFLGLGKKKYERALSPEESAQRQQALQELANAP